jgi:hypothetical protein
MKKSVPLTVFIVLLGVVCSYAQSLPCDQGNCELGPRWVTETPRGPVDGVNTVFTLSGIPEPDSQVRVFRNGIALETPQDFEISQETISLKPSQVPLQGDVLKAMYIPSSHRHSSRMLGSDGQVEPRPTSVVDEITIEAGREALAAEAAGFERIAKGRDRMYGDDPRSVSQSAGTEPASIRMLSRRIRDNRGSLGSGRDLQGIEGTGDEPLASPFDEGDFTADQRDDSSISQRVLSMPRSSAVRILQRKFDARAMDSGTPDEQQFIPKRKKKTVHIHAALQDVWR